METLESLERIDNEIGKLREKVKTYQNRIATLTDRKKKLQDQALLEQLYGIAPDFKQARRVLDRLETEAPTPVNGGIEHERQQIPPRDG